MLGRAKKVMIGRSTRAGAAPPRLRPQSGVIEIDGIDIKAMKLSALRRKIGVVFQEGMLFNRSIAEIS